MSGPAFSPTLRLLALDSAGETLALALTEGASLRAAHSLPGGAQASATLLPALQALLAGQGWAWGDVQGIAFGQGPGAFTGLRSACAVAQGLAYGLDLPVLAIDSLLLVAEDAHAQAGAPENWDCAVRVDARMQEVYHARYRRQQGGWQVLAAPALARPEAVPPGAGVAAGNGWPAGALLGQDRAAALARLAVQAARAGAWRDAAEAQPLYVRDKVALTTAERQAAAAC